MSFNTYLNIKPFNYKTPYLSIISCGNGNIPIWVKLTFNVN